MIRLDSEKMELKVVFGNLVHNRYMKHFNYRTRFKFRTVFKKTIYSYSCCPCGFEHEFLDYIGENGVINEEVYEKITQSIADGKCPHVTDKVSIEWVTETSITGLHIAVALGTEIGGIRRKEITKRDEGIFGVNLQSIVHVKKKKNESIAAAKKDFVYYYSKLPENTSINTVKKVSYFEALVQRRDGEWLRKCLKLTDQKPVNEDMLDSFSKAFDFTLNHGLTDLTKILLNYMVQRADCFRMMPRIIRSLIMYNKPEILEQFLARASNDSAFDVTAERMCHIFRKPECKKVLQDQDLCEEVNFPGICKFQCLCALQQNYFDSFKDEIVEALKQIPDVETYIDLYFFRRPAAAVVAINPQVVKTFLDLVDIAKLKFKTVTMLNSIVCPQTCSVYKIQTREAVKVLVNTNIDLHQSETVIVIPLELSKDSQLYDDRFRISKVGTYLADVREHGRFGYQGDNFALNFSGPFFLECGFPVKRFVLEEYLNKETLHPAIHDYIKRYIDKNFDNPKPLMIQCREFLRRHFKGNALLSFLENSGSPQSVKDFVLMKYLLQPLEQQLL